jgi:hypothetical protein
MILGPHGWIKISNHWVAGGNRQCFVDREIEMKARPLPLSVDENVAAPKLHQKAQGAEISGSNPLVAPYLRHENSNPDGLLMAVQMLGVRALARWLP